MPSLMPKQAAGAGVGDASKVGVFFVFFVFFVCYFYAINVFIL